MTVKQFYRPDEASVIFGVCRKTIIRWCKIGRLDGYRISSKTIRIPGESIENLKKQLKINGTIADNCGQ